VLWKKEVVSACHKNAASPLIWDDLLIITGVRLPENKVALLAAFNKNTGEPVWNYGIGETTGGETPTFGHVTPIRTTINGVEQIIYNTGALACGVNPKTGTAYWEFRYKMPGANVNASSPVTDGSMVGIMLGDGSGRPFGLKIENNASATLVWDKIPNFRAMWCDPILKDGFLYTFNSDGLYSGANSDFRCVDFKTGQPRWVEKKSGCGSLIEVDGHLLCLTHSGNLWLVAPTPEGFNKVAEWKGAIQTEPWWTSNGGKTPAPCWTVPVIARGKLYLRYGNTLSCYDLLQ
jgi:outer membrane protein assembly factor BamB